MTLLELEPEFFRYEERIETWKQIVGDHETWEARGNPTKEVTGPRVHYIIVEDLAKAQGMWFLCPKCSKVNGGRVGTHMCHVTFADRGVPDHVGTHNSKGKTVRWVVSGSGPHDLTLSPSILLEGGCNWHGFVKQGKITE